MQVDLVKFKKAVGDMPFYLAGYPKLQTLNPKP